MDLMEMIPYAAINDGYRYILRCVDVYSRVARAEPLKTKEGVAVAAAITRMLKHGAAPRYIQTDLGKEFYNAHVAKLLKTHAIRHYSVHSQFKAALVERFNRTLREKLSRYFTRHGKKVWIGVLPQLIETYNHTPHRGLAGHRPVDVQTNNNLNHWKLTQEKPSSSKKTKPHHPVGTLVRISRISVSNPFRRNFDQNWSEELFRVAAVDTRETPVMYVLEDLRGEVLQGKFYTQELQVISGGVPSVYRIEQVLRARGTGKHKQYLVKWVGYDASHNSWINQDQLVSQI